ncbi:hypothetical protein FRC12_010339 [Ceratobasidium sp. 428]|nr:hypothetical protein FRC12_010339 [Ceratobasidium sp. 428]
MGDVTQKGTEVRTGIDVGVYIGIGATPMKKRAIQIEYEKTSFITRDIGECREAHALVEESIGRLLTEWPNLNTILTLVEATEGLGPLTISAQLEQQDWSIEWEWKGSRG